MKKNSNKKLWPYANKKQEKFIKKWNETHDYYPLREELNQCIEITGSSLDVRKLEKRCIIFYARLCRMQTYFDSNKMQQYKKNKLINIIKELKIRYDIAFKEYVSLNQILK